jgi:NAD(P)-dependent dehydrogenase (short-subunit alcohol dehydrogenase family)
VKLKAGQVAVVTGGASGIGFALAEAFGARGLSVVLGDVEATALDDAASRLSANGVKVLPFTVDVSDAVQVDDLADQALEHFGRVDVVCNNAGVMIASRQPMWEIGYHDWVWLLNVNLWGVINGLRTFVPMLVEQGHGHIVNTASLAGIATIPEIAPYTASKHAVVGLTEALRVELAEHAPEVGVTVVCPGSVATRLREAARNRPASLTPPAPTAAPSATDGPRTEVLDAADVAAQTLDAIEANRLHIAPGRGLRKLVKARVNQLLADID